MSAWLASVSAWLQDLQADFIKDFIEKNRFKTYILRGLRNTLTITLLALVIGVLLGFLIAIIRSTYVKTGKLKILNVVCAIYVTVLRGVPVVVQLLIFYFIIFAKNDPGIVMTSVICFGLNSSAYVSEIVRSGIMSIDNGQFEAGRSLGFNYVQTMWYIVLPQAMKNVLPALGNDFIALLKETSIAGYIGVTDLTKGADIIRSQTFDALLPLFVIAAIYLVLVMVLTKLVGIMERRLRNSDH